MTGVALLLSACSAAGPEPQVSASPSVMVLDDGALTVTAVSDASTVVTAEQVREDLALSSDQNVQELGSLTLGRVRWGPGVWLGAPAIAQDRLVWVQFWRDSTNLLPDDPVVHACGGAGINPPSPTTPVSDPSRQHALVVDATTGAAAIYAGAGPSACYVYSPPIAFPATRTDSVPWKALSGNRVRVTLPPCSVYWGMGRDTRNAPWQAAASRGFAACATSTTSKTFTEPSRLSSDHAPIGPLCARIAKGVPLTRPAACVN
jgi:hypothetical protein